jgi:hypothetical protein
MWISLLQVMQVVFKKENLQRHDSAKQILHRERVTSPGAKNRPSAGGLPASRPFVLQRSGTCTEQQRLTFCSAPSCTTSQHAFATLFYMRLVRHDGIKSPVVRDESFFHRT